MINVHLLTLSCMSLETGTISDMRREKRPGWQLPLWMMVLLKKCPAFSTNITGGEQMTKIRVHEYAKQIDKSSKEVIEQLTKTKYSSNESYVYA